MKNLPHYRPHSGGLLSWALLGAFIFIAPESYALDTERYKYQKFLPAGIVSYNDIVRKGTPRRPPPRADSFKVAPLFHQFAPKPQTFTFGASGGASVTTAGGLQLEIPAKAFVNLAGEPPDKPVTLYIMESRPGVSALATGLENTFYDEGAPYPVDVVFKIQIAAKVGPTPLKLANEKVIEVKWPPTTTPKQSAYKDMAVYHLENGFWQAVGRPAQGQSMKTKEVAGLLVAPVPPPDMALHSLGWWMVGLSGRTTVCVEGTVHNPYHKQNFNRLQVGVYYPGTDSLSVFAGKISGGKFRVQTLLGKKARVIITDSLGKTGLSGFITPHALGQGCANIGTIQLQHLSKDLRNSPGHLEKYLGFAAN